MMKQISNSEYLKINQDKTILLNSVDWFKTADQIFDKHKRLFITAPRQCGKTIYLLKTIISNVENYDYIYIVTHRADMARHIFSLMDLNIYKPYYEGGKMTGYKFNNGKNSCFIHNKLIRGVRGRRMLVVVDEFAFDYKLFDKLEDTSELYDYDLLAVSSFQPSTIHEKVRTFQLDFDYKHFHVNYYDAFGDNTTRLENALKMNTWTEYL